MRIAAHLDVPHHEGAGGVEDFADKESFQRHVKRVSNRNKRKRRYTIIIIPQDVARRLHQPLKVQVRLEVALKSVNKVVKLE